MKKIILSILAIFMGTLLVVPMSAFAASRCVKTSILSDTKCSESNGELVEGGGEINCKCDNSDGGNIFKVLALIVDIMTIGIGILGVIGISVAGVQYLTAGGSEEKTRKAKRRLFEIVIGLIAYVVIYSLLRWLLPRYNDDILKSFYSETQIAQVINNSENN